MNLVEELIKNKFLYGVGVPCSILKNIILDLENSDRFMYISAVDEITALGIVNGLTVGGKRSVLITQNSAVGRVLDNVMSFNIPYEVPLLWIISMRGDINDTVVHKPAGKITKQWLRDVGFCWFEDWFDEITKLYEHKKLIAIGKYK